ncbi:hypothetical protein FACS189414_5260 [Bacteroidia bacterium]|nr:hypothetical protein AGMMS49574_28280 [Bacteroidia bacterium]GHU77981.1 hypothetical protein FACS189414_5260 [Bacteroidia bacterium]
MKCINRIEKECRQNGLSKEVIKQSLGDIQHRLFNGNSRMRSLGEAISLFLPEEGKILENEKSIHNNSSDIIESTFGAYKLRKSPDKLYGVTPFILFMPTYVQLTSKRCDKHCSVKKHLENVRLRQIQEWTKENLTINLVVKRINTLNIAG